MMEWLRQIKWFIQRGKRGYSDYDLWDFHSYLSPMIAKALRDLAQKKRGCPSEFWDDKAVNDECHRWKECLEEMAQGFEAAEYLQSYKYRIWVSTENGRRLELDKEGLENAEKKMQRGLELFAKHYLSLWD